MAEALPATQEYLQPKNKSCIPMVKVGKLNGPSYTLHDNACQAYLSRVHRNTEIQEVAEREFCDSSIISLGVLNWPAMTQVMEDLLDSRLQMNKTPQADGNNSIVDCRAMFVVSRMVLASKGSGNKFTSAIRKFMLEYVYGKIPV